MMTLDGEQAAEIRGYLSARGISLEMLALRVGIHRSTLVKKLAGKSDITALELLKLGEKLGNKGGTQLGALSGGGAQATGR